MPPHCDSLDGPVVTAARQALEADDVDLVLPFVHADGETEVSASRCTATTCSRLCTPHHAGDDGQTTALAGER